MKINNINSYSIRFGIKTVQKPQENKQGYFYDLLQQSGSIAQQKYQSDLPDKKQKTTNPMGRDLVLHKTQKPLPFALSDKKLTLDEYQEAAIELFRDGKNVMVTAPTGTGKTLIAEHAINDILKSGKKVIYTTPLKALCNDKYKQFSKLFGDYDEFGNLIGSSKIGLATGDVKINSKAPLVVMTTEIYRNMLTQHGEKDIEKLLKDVDAVIFDEFHYMGDSQRGSVWEEALMFSPPKIKHLMLSATIANANPINDWLNTTKDHHKSVVVNVPEDERHVPLKYLSYSQLGTRMSLYDLLDEKIDLNKLKTKNLSSKEREVLATIANLVNEENGIKALETKFSDVFCDFGSRASLNNFVNRLVYYGMPRKKAEQCGLRLVDKTSRNANKALSKIDCVRETPLADLVKDLEKKNMTPALYFVYSKKNCKKYMKKVSDEIGQLLTEQERQDVLDKISEVQAKGIFLGVDFESDIKPCLLNGFAMHHSGMLPQCKSFIENLGRNKLIKVCFATDTLGAGINFPFKTVVFGDFEKFTDSGLEEISVNSFKQGAGRAGRRGIDEIGYVVSIPKDRDEVLVPVSKIIEDSEDVQSAFKLSYGLILSPRFLNQPMRILEKSFDNYQRKNSDEYLQKSDTMKYLLKRKKFVEPHNGILRLTQKGKIASKIRGINELLITEILFDNKLMENITPSELASIISMFAPERENSFENIPNNYNNPEFTEKVKDTIELALNLKDLETQGGLESDIKINTRAMSYIKKWAEAPTTTDSKLIWCDLIKSMLQNNVISSEGDFFKKINYTTNILKQLRKAAPTQYLKDTASQAVKMLQKSPVDDILLYELGYKEKDEQI